MVNRESPKNTAPVTEAVTSQSAELSDLNAPQKQIDDAHKYGTSPIDFRAALTEYPAFRWIVESHPIKSSPSIFTSHSFSAGERNTPVIGEPLYWFPTALDFARRLDPDRHSASGSTEEVRRKELERYEATIQCDLVGAIYGAVRDLYHKTIIRPTEHFTSPPSLKNFQMATPDGIKIASSVSHLLSMAVDAERFAYVEAARLAAILRLPPNEKKFVPKLPIEILCSVIRGDPFTRDNLARYTDPRTNTPAYCSLYSLAGTKSIRDLSQVKVAAAFAEAQIARCGVDGNEEATWIEGLTFCDPAGKFFCTGQNLIVATGREGQVAEAKSRTGPSKLPYRISPLGILADDPAPRSIDGTKQLMLQLERLGKIRYSLSEQLRDLKGYRSQNDLLLTRMAGLSDRTRGQFAEILSHLESGIVGAIDNQYGAIPFQNLINLLGSRTPGDRTLIIDRLYALTQKYDTELNFHILDTGLDVSKAFLTRYVELFETLEYAIQQMRSTAKGEAWDGAFLMRLISSDLGRRPTAGEAKKHVDAIVAIAKRIGPELGPDVIVTWQGSIGCHLRHNDKLKVYQLALKLHSKMDEAGIAKNTQHFEVLREIETRLPKIDSCSQHESEQRTELIADIAGAVLSEYLAKQPRKARAVGQNPLEDELERLSGDNSLVGNLKYAEQRQEILQIIKKAKGESAAQLADILKCLKSDSVLDYVDTKEGLRPLGNIIKILKATDSIIHPIIIDKLSKLSANVGPLATVEFLDLGLAVGEYFLATPLHLIEIFGSHISSPAEEGRGFDVAFVLREACLDLTPRTAPLLSELVDAGMALHKEAGEFGSETWQAWHMETGQLIKGKEKLRLLQWAGALHRELTKAGVSGAEHESKIAYKVAERFKVPPSGANSARKLADIMAVTKSVLIKELAINTVEKKERFAIALTLCQEEYKSKRDKFVPRPPPFSNAKYDDERWNVSSWNSVVSAYPSLICLVDPEVSDRDSRVVLNAASKLFQFNENNGQFFVHVPTAAEFYKEARNLKDPGEVYEKLVREKLVDVLYEAVGEAVEGCRIDDFADGTAPSRLKGVVFVGRNQNLIASSFPHLLSMVCDAEVFLAIEKCKLTDQLRIRSAAFVPMLTPIDILVKVLKSHRLESAELARLQKGYIEKNRGYHGYCSLQGLRDVSDNQEIAKLRAQDLVQEATIARCGIYRADLHHWIDDLTFFDPSGKFQCTGRFLLERAGRLEGSREESATNNVAFEEVIEAIGAIEIGNRGGPNSRRPEFHVEVQKLRNLLGQCPNHDLVHKRCAYVLESVKNERHAFEDGALREISQLNELLAAVAPVKRAELINTLYFFRDDYGDEAGHYILDTGLEVPPRILSTPDVLISEIKNALEAFKGTPGLEPWEALWVIHQSAEDSQSSEQFTKMVGVGLALVRQLGNSFGQETYQEWSCAIGEHLKGHEKLELITWAFKFHQTLAARGIAPREQMFDIVRPIRSEIQAQTYRRKSLSLLEIMEVAAKAAKLDPDTLRPAKSPEEKRNDLYRQVFEDLEVPIETAFLALCALGETRESRRRFRDYRDLVIKAKIAGGDSSPTEKSKKPLEVFREFIATHHKPTHKFNIRELGLIRFSGLLKQLCYREYNGDYGKMLGELQEYKKSVRVKDGENSVAEKILDAIVPRLITSFERVRQFKDPETLLFTPLPHQREGVLAAMEEEKPILLSGSGTGKTESGALYAELCEIPGALWCTKTSVRPDTVRRLHEEILKPGRNVVEITSAQIVANRLASEMDTADYVVISYDTLKSMRRNNPDSFAVVRRWVQGSRCSLDSLKKSNRDAFKIARAWETGRAKVLDEAHVLDNPNSDRSVALQDISIPADNEDEAGLDDPSSEGVATLEDLTNDRTIVLTATPFQHRPERCATLLHVALPKKFPDPHALIAEFKADKLYARAVLHAHATVCSIEDVAKTFESFAIRSAKDQLADGIPRIPKLEIHRQEYEMSLEHSMLYHDYALNYAGCAARYGIPSNRQFNCLRRLAIHPEKLGASPPHALIEAVRKIAIPAFERGEKVLILGQQHHPLRLIMADPDLRRHGMALIHGEVAPKDRIDIVNQLENDPNLRCVAAQLDVGSTGLNFRSVSHIICIERPLVTANLMQAIRRHIRLLVEGDERFAKEVGHVWFLETALNPEVLEAVKDPNMRRYLERGTIYKEWLSRDWALLEEYSNFIAPSSRHGSSATTATAMMESLAKAHEGFVEARAQFQLLAPEGLGEHFHRYRTPIKHVWRDSALGKFVEVNIGRLTKPANKLRGAILPGPEALEVELYLGLGVSSGNILGFESDQSENVRQACARVLSRKGCQFFASKIEKVLPYDKEEMDFISIDTNGYVTEGLFDMCVRLNMAPRCMILKNSLTQRESGPAAQLLEAAGGDRRNLDLEMMKLTGTDLAQQMGIGSPIELVRVSEALQKVARQLAEQCHASIGGDLEIWTELLHDLSRRSPHFKSFEQFEYGTPKGRPFLSTFVLLEKWDPEFGESQEAVTLRDLVRKAAINSSGPAAFNAVKRRGDLVISDVGSEGMRLASVNLRRLKILYDYYRLASPEECRISNIMRAPSERLAVG